MNKLLIAAAASALITIPAVAQMVQGSSGTGAMPPQTRADVEARVKDRLGKLDANHDGVVTRDEMTAFRQAKMKAHADEAFASMDTNKDGQISRAEFDARHAVPRERKIANFQHYSDAGKGPDGPSPTHMRMMMHDRGGMMMADGSGQIVIADAVKKALDRFDKADTNHDGTLSPEERRAARDAMRAEWKARRG